MGRDRSVYFHYIALVLLSTSSPTTAGLWTVDIDHDPAPSPEDGPPLSANASRDLALLPYQIVGIFAAYIGSVVIVGTLLLTVGRSRRKKAQVMASAPKEMVKPMPKAFDPSPISPSSSWYSPKKVQPKKSAASSVRSTGSHTRSPGMDSVASFDNGVIEADRARRQEEMERLYAAVMQQHDERTASQQNVANAAPPDYASRKPPRLITDDPGLRHLQIPSSGPVSPSTPKSPVRAIYPPTSSVPAGPTSPKSPIRAEYANYSLPAQASSDPHHRTNRECRPTSSIGSSQMGSPKSKRVRKSLRNIKISAPLPTDDNSDGARTPLSPRTYGDPGTPPEPPTARTNDSSAYQPSTPGTGKGCNRSEDVDEIRQLPQPNPQRVVTPYTYDNQAQIATNNVSTRSRSTGTLPFRELNHHQSPNYNPASAGPVKTTFLHAPPPGPQQQPYSPYMPFTPVTPVTPHLTSRGERKQRAREARGRAVVEEERVVEEGVLWGVGY